MREATTALGHLQEALRTAPGPVVRLDASALRELDTAAISVLMQCKRLVLARGLALQIESAPAKLMALMALYGVSDLFGFSGLSPSAAGSAAP